jgi:ribonuclease D
VLADQAIIDAARLPVTGQPPLTRPQLDKIGGFRARNARRHAARWLAAVLRARELGDDELPEVTGPATIPGPPPAHRWSERDPDAAARLAAAREAVTAVAEAHRLPTENLLAPDTVRRITWEPPQPATPEAVAAALAGYGARPWQVELTAGPLAAAFREAEAAPPPGPDEPG